MWYVTLFLYIILKFYYQRIIFLGKLLKLLKAISYWACIEKFDKTKQKAYSVSDVTLAQNIWKLQNL